MNVVYNAEYGRFEAQFSNDFNGDLAAVKAAKFKCDGPPTWVWWTVKLASLNLLRENKPISGLTINESAYAQYMRLSEMEAKNEEARKAFAPVKEEQTKAKKKRQKEQRDAQTYVNITIPEKPGELYNFIGAEDLSPMPPRENAFVAPVHPGPWCSVCRAPVYPYEKQEPTPVCLFCEKTLDNQGKVCHTL